MHVVYRLFSEHSSDLSNYRYGYDNKGLMTYRSESVINRTEQYLYDKLDRLTQITTTEGTSKPVIQQFSFATNGNIANNSAVGVYKYNSMGSSGVRAHAVSEITPVNNAVFPSTDCLVEYNFYNQPTQIKEGAYRLELSYGANQQRNKAMRYKNEKLENTRFYINKQYEKEIDSLSVVRHYHYIYGDYGVVALHVKNETANNDSIYYIHTDHLGSYCAITSASKRVVQRNYFDAWGNYKLVIKGNRGTSPPGNEPQIGTGLPVTFGLTDRGFTGHEHYPYFKIINMNGRLYDPVIGRFFSPDKYVANSSFTQDFNRYSYARNCPLMYTDPSGEFFWFFPTISWSREGGVSFGISAIFGIPGVINVSAGIGFSPRNTDISFTVGVTAAFNSFYVSASTYSGLSVGWSVGLSPQLGLPISSNFTSIGINYNLTHGELSFNISAWSIDRNGVRFNPSFSATVLPEEFTNLVKGGGFRSNQQVFDRMMSRNTCQEILDYFEFKGTYDPNHEAWEKYGISPAMMHPKTGEILYHDYPFQGNYERLALIAHHESIHRKDWRLGHKYSDMEVYKDEWYTYMINYKNLGLYPSQEKLIRGRINDYGLWSGTYEAPYTYFKSEWWHFFYKIPRLW